MKTKYLINSIPFLSTLLLVIILNISNQKVNTKIRILIWNTPTLSLGTYLTISAGSGFILSYIATTIVAKINNTTSYKSINYKHVKTNEKINDLTDTNFINTYEKTLIERDINDPSPTMNAQFRVIGRTERYNTDYNDNIIFNNSNKFQDPYIEDPENNETINQVKEISSDWNDDSFTSW